MSRWSSESEAREEIKRYLENSKINTSLPYWYIFKDNNIDMFLPRAESNGES